MKDISKMLLHWYFARRKNLAILQLLVLSANQVYLHWTMQWWQNRLFNFLYSSLAPFDARRTAFMRRLLVLYFLLFLILHKIGIKHVLLFSILMSNHNRFGSFYSLDEITFFMISSFCTQLDLIARKIRQFLLRCQNG